MKAVTPAPPSKLGGNGKHIKQPGLFFQGQLTLFCSVPFRSSIKLGLSEQGLWLENLGSGVFHKHAVTTGIHA